MGLFGRSADVDRMKGQILALRITMDALLEEISGDFALRPELVKRHEATLEFAKAEGLAPEAIEGFVDFMRSFIVHAGRHG